MEEDALKMAGLASDGRWSILVFGLSKVSQPSKFSQGMRQLVSRRWLVLVMARHHCYIPTVLH